jgi:ribosomal protein S20
MVGAGAVMAQDSGAETPTATATQSAGPHALGDGDGHWRRGVVVGVIRSVLDASGLDATVFRPGFEDGKTVNEILTENGLDPATVQADALAAIKSKLDARVADGAITQDQADKAYANIAQRLPEFMDNTHDLDGRRLGGRVLRGLKNMLGSAADVLGMQASDLAQRLRGGETVATIAGEQGVSVDTVIDAIVADVDARIDQAVANGTIDQARADQMKANLRERVTTFVNEGPRHQHDGAGMQGERSGARMNRGEGHAMGAMARFGR